MIIDLKGNLKALPFKSYTATLLKSEDDIKDRDGYLYISKSPKMVILFTESVDEIHGKVIKETANSV